jgi:hypothetical protein
MSGLEVIANTVAIQSATILKFTASYLELLWPSSFLLQIFPSAQSVCASCVWDSLVDQESNTSEVTLSQGGATVTGCMYQLLMP